MLRGEPDAGLGGRIGWRLIDAFDNPPGGRAGDSTVATTCSAIFVCGPLMTPTSHGRDFGVVSKPVPWPRGGRFILKDYPEKTTHVARDRPRASSCFAYRVKHPLEHSREGPETRGSRLGVIRAPARLYLSRGIAGASRLRVSRPLLAVRWVTLALKRTPASPVVRISSGRAEDGLSCGVQASVSLEEWRGGHRWLCVGQRKSGIV